jgi:hypothetical protein
MDAIKLHQRRPDRADGGALPARGIAARKRKAVSIFGSIPEYESRDYSSV